MEEELLKFAQQIKTKYPDYQDVDDFELVERIVRKHPVYASQVKLPDNFRLLQTSSGYQKIDDLYEQIGREENVDPNLLLEQGRKETRFKPEVFYGLQNSPKGARGAGQFMPGTAPTYGLTVNANQDDRTDPTKSIRAQAKYMRKLLDQFDNNEDLALAGYNSGEYRQSLKEGRVPNIAETQDYVKEISENLKKARSVKVKSLREMFGTSKIVSPTIPQTDQNTQLDKFEDYRNGGGQLDFATWQEQSQPVVTASVQPVADNFTPSAGVLPQEASDLELLNQQPEVGKTDWNQHLPNPALLEYAQLSGLDPKSPETVRQFNEILKLSQDAATKENSLSQNQQRLQVNGQNRQNAVRSPQGTVQTPQTSLSQPTDAVQTPVDPSQFREINTTLNYTGPKNRFDQARFVETETGRLMLAAVPGATRKDLDAVRDRFPIKGDGTVKDKVDISIKTDVLNAVADARDRRLATKKATIANLIASNTDLSALPYGEEKGGLDLRGIKLEDVMSAFQDPDTLMQSALEKRNRVSEAKDEIERQNLLVETGQTTRAEADKRILEEQAAREKIEKDIKESDSNYAWQAYQMDADTYKKITKNQQTVDDFLKNSGFVSAKDLLNQQEKERKESTLMWKRIAANPNSAALEFTKNLVRTVPKTISNVFKGISIGSELLDQMPGGVLSSYLKDERAAKDRGFYQLGKWLDAKTDEFLPQDEQLKKSFILNTLPDAVGQLITHLGAGLATGGATVPLLLGVSSGASEAYEEADRFKATNNEKLLASVVGGLASAPDVLPIAKWIRPLTNTEKAGFLTKLINNLYGKTAAELGEQQAESLAKQFLKNSFKGGLFEGAQEVSENKINDALASLTYDKKRKIFTVNNRDIESFLAGFIGGSVGGSVETTLENKYEPNLTDEQIEKLTPENVKQALDDSQNGTEKQKNMPIEAKESPIARRNEVNELLNLGYSPKEIDKIESADAKEIIENKYSPKDWADIQKDEANLKPSDFQLENKITGKKPETPEIIENEKTEVLSQPTPVDEKTILPENQAAEVSEVEPAAKNETPKTKLRSLPKTLREAGLEADDQFYTVFGNEDARKEADKRLNNLGLDKTIVELENKESYDKADAVLSVKAQRVLQNQAKLAEESGDLELAKEYRTRSLELGSKHARLATKAGQFNQAAAMLATTADGVLYHANKLSEKKGGLDKTDYEIFETLGTKGEDGFNTLEIYQNEIKGLKERISELEKGNRKPLERYSSRVTTRAKAKITNPDQLKAEILKQFKLPSQAGTVVLKTAKIDEETGKKIAEYGASLLLNKPLSEIKREDFYTEMRKSFGRRFDEDLPKIYAASLNLRNELLSNSRSEMQKEKLKAEFPDKSEKELAEIAKTRSKEREVKKQTGNLAKKLAQIYSPSVAKQTQKILDAAETISDNDTVLDYAEKILTKEAKPEDLLRKNRKVYLQAQKLISDAKQVVAEEKERIKEEVVVSQANLKTLEKEEYLQRQRIKQITNDLAREYRRLEENPIKFYGKEGLKLLGETRSLLASGDLSGSLRQGFYFTVTNPLLNLKGTEDLNGAFGGMLKSISKTRHADLMVQIENHPNFDTMLKMGIEFADAGTDFSSLTGAEENIRTEYIKRIPIAKQWLEASERTYSGFLDLQRALMADSIIKELESTGKTFKSNPEEFEAVGKLINIATGRGNLTSNKQLNDAVSSFGRVLFAPRYAVSRFQLINHLFNPASMAMMPPAVRKIAVKRALRFHAAISLPLLAAGAAGLVSLDPDDDDFLKIRIGSKARYETTGGLQSYLRYLGQMGKAVAFGKNPKEVGTSIGRTNLNFWSKKLAPIPSYGYAMMTGKEADTSEFNYLKSAYMRMIPITIKEFGENTYEDGVLGFLATTPTALGIGTGYYKDKNNKAIKNDLNKTVKKVREKMLK